MLQKEPYRVALIAFDGVHSLDISGPWEVFDTANRMIGRKPGYALQLLGAPSRQVTSSAKLRWVCDARLANYRQPIHTLLVCGGDGIYEACQSKSFVQSIQRLAKISDRIGSICTGAFALAAAGLLDGRKATTHWSACGRLASEYPSIQVDCDSIYVRDEQFYTSAGVTAGIDMALAIVEQDYGHTVATQVAQDLVVFLRRPGGQSQFSVASRRQEIQDASIRELQLWMVEHPEADLSVAALARHVRMSERNFSRVFTAEVGTSPGKYVQQLRIEIARQYLEQTKRSIDAIAHACGFGNELSMRRSFQKVLGINPSEYRKRFTSG
ncbi:MAG: helix-turn-helix domain-containing protein [Cyanobacteria bacterium P01_H01_bin.21]